MLVNRGMGGGINAGQSFFLPLGDAGSGAVNTTPVSAFGDGTPTFTRADNTATTVNSAGLIVPVNANIARSYYDPTTLTYRGYLAEGARTNLLLRSEEFDNASWTKTDTTITANSIAAPDGATTADLFTEGTAGTAQVAQAQTATADVSYAVSRFVKYSATQWMRMIVGNGANTFQAWFDIQNGVVGTSSTAGTGTVTSATIVAYPNGWYRIILVGTVGSGATSISTSTLSASANAAGRLNSATRYEWGAQFENNVTFASSYIPTTTASVTRNADVLTYAFAGNASATAGACYAELSSEWTTGAGAHVAVGFLPSSVGVLYVSTGIPSTSIRSGDGTAATTKGGLTSMATAARKRASSWGAAGQSATGDGATVATAAFDGDMGSTAIGIGIEGDGAGSEWFGTIRNVRIWTRQLTDAQLQGVTS